MRTLGYRTGFVAPSGALRLVMLAITGFSALNALAGGLGLIFSGLGVPTRYLDGTPFPSFVVPGILLAGVVGGTMTAATVLLWRRHVGAVPATIFAGLTMLTWIVVEALMIPDGRGLQMVVALLAIATSGLGMWALGEDRHPRARMRHRRA